MSRVPLFAPREKLGQTIGDVPDWKPHERPMIPGSPSTPDMPGSERLKYGLVALLLGLTGSLGTALVSVNLNQIQGELGLTPVQGAWLSSIYIMTNVAMNLLLVKYRQQFGISRFVMVFLTIYAGAAVAELFVTGYPIALLVRAVSGVTGAAMGALTVFYMLQALPPKYKLQALVLGIGASQLGMPLARILSPMLIVLGGWHGVSALEAGLAVASLAAVLIVRIPPGIRIHTFEWKDIVSFLLFASGFALVVAVLGLGRLEWWFDRPWLGWALAAGVALILIGWTFEHYRENPLVDTRWFLTGGYFRFAIAILFVRMLLSEQPVGSTGLLQALGMAPEQVQHLYVIVAFATVAGVLAGAVMLMISPKLVIVQSLGTLILIAIGAWMDAHSTVQTAPANLYVSQALIGFAAAMFMGAAVMLGIGQLVQRGFGSVITFSVTFGVTQVIGGVLGGAILGTFQIWRAQHHAAYLSEALVGSNPQVASLLQTYSGAFRSSIADPAGQSLQGLSTVAQQVTQQANVLAFNDVFWLIFWVAITQLVLTVIFTVRTMLKMRNAPKSADTPSAAGAAAI